MIESTVISWLNANNITAYGEEPKNSYPNEYFSRDSFCVVQKTGGGVERRLRNATIAVQSYAPTLAQAAELNEAVLTVMEQMIELSDITAVRLNSDYEFSKESTKQPRYQAVFEIYYY